MKAVLFCFIVAFVAPFMTVEAKCVPRPKMMHGHQGQHQDHQQQQQQQQHHQQQKGSITTAVGDYSMESTHVHGNSIMNGHGHGHGHRAVSRSETGHGDKGQRRRSHNRKGTHADGHNGGGGQRRKSSNHNHQAANH